MVDPLVVRWVGMMDDLLAAWMVSLWVVEWVVAMVVELVVWKVDR